MTSLTLTNNNFLLYAVKHYENPQCMGMREFSDDLKRFKYIKKLLKRYGRTGIINEKLVLNHLILLHNVFDEALIPMLFFKFEECYWSQLKTFLVFLNYIPDNYIVRGVVFETDITLDTTIINKLRKI